MLISQLVHVACQGIAVQTANHVLRVATTSDERRANLSELLGELDNRQAMTEAMKGERAMGVLTFQQMRDGTLDPTAIGDSGAFHKLSSTWMGRAYLNDDEAKYIEVLDRQIDAIEQNRTQRTADMDAMWDEVMSSSRFRHIITKLLAPALNAAVDAVDRREAQNRCLRVLLAIEGQTEADLEKLDLPATAKIDPYSGSSLLMKRVDDEWIVYSVGENEVDDGGDVIEDYEYSVDSPLDIGLGPLAEPLEVDATDDEVGVIDPYKE